MLKQNLVVSMNALCVYWSSFKLPKMRVVVASKRQIVLKSTLNFHSLSGRKEVNYSKSKAPPVAAVSLASASTADVRTTPVPLHKHPLTRSKSIPSIPTTASPLPAEMTNASACASPPLTGEHLQPILIEESHPADGMAMRIFSNGDKVISLANGQKEVHCDAFKVRLYVNWLPGDVACIRHGAWNAPLTKLEGR